MKEFRHPRGRLCYIVQLAYAKDGSIALALVDTSICSFRGMITAYRSDHQRSQDEILVKNYAENVGMPAAIAATGIAAPTGKFLDAGISHFPVMRLNREVLAEYTVGPGTPPWPVSQTPVEILPPAVRRFVRQT